MLDLTRSVHGMKREQTIVPERPGSRGYASQRHRESHRPHRHSRETRVLPATRGFPPPRGHDGARRAVTRHQLRAPVCVTPVSRSRRCRMPACRALSWSGTPLHAAPILRPTTPARPALVASTRRSVSARLSNQPVPDHKFFTHFLHLMLQSCKRAGSNSFMSVPFICNPALLRNRRVAAGLSVAALARIAKVDGTTISRIEEGQDPRLSTWNRINAALPQALD